MVFIYIFKEFIINFSCKGLEINGAKKFKTSRKFIKGIEIICKK